MELPLSAQPVLARFSFDYNDMKINSTNTTPTVMSVVDQISGMGASQLVVADQPTFALSSYRVPPFYDGLAFNGSSQLLQFDSLASTVATLNAFTIFVAFKASSPSTTNQDLFTFGKGTSGDGYFRLSVSGSGILGINKSDTPTVVSISGGSVDTNPHWAALSSSGGIMTLTLDGATIGSSAVSGTNTLTTCSIGALRNNSATANYFAGTIYEAVVYKGLADMSAVGTYFSAVYKNSLHRTY
jgi:hypothetical protein